MVISSVGWCGVQLSLGRVHPGMQVIIHTGACPDGEIIVRIMGLIHSDVVRLKILFLSLLYSVIMEIPPGATTNQM